VPQKTFHRESWNALAGFYPLLLTSSFRLVFGRSEFQFGLLYIIDYGLMTLHTGIIDEPVCRFRTHVLFSLVGKLLNRIIVRL